MNYTYAEFITFFPEFSDSEENTINRLINRIVLIDNEFKGIENTDKRKLAIYLKLAHYISILNRKEEDEAIAPVKSISSMQSRIEFALSEDQKGFQLSSTIYGKQLKDLLYNDLPLPVGGLY